MKQSIHQSVEELQNTPSHQREHTAQNTGPWRGIFFDGPQADTDADGDEVPVWCVYVGDEEAEPIHRIYWLWNYNLALDLANRMARDRRLELIAEASAA
jgi:hypothetical protein